MIFWSESAEKFVSIQIWTAETFSFLNQKFKNYNWLSKPKFAYLCCLKTLKLTFLVNKIKIKN